MQHSSHSNTLEPWQEQLLIKGMMQGQELKLTMAGRQTGKSMLRQQAIDRLIRDLNNRPIENLVLSEGKVYGSRYYCVEPVGGNWLNMETWCMEVFGEGSRALWGEDKAPEPACRWYANNRKFWFRNERDRTMFIMRWSSQ